MKKPFRPHVIRCKDETAKTAKFLRLSANIVDGGGAVNLAVHEVQVFGTPMPSRIFLLSNAE